MFKKGHTYKFINDEARKEFIDIAPTTNQVIADFLGDSPFKVEELGINENVYRISCATTDNKPVSVSESEIMDIYSGLWFWQSESRYFEEVETNNLINSDVIRKIMDMYKVVLVPHEAGLNETTLCSVTEFSDFISTVNQRHEVWKKIADRYQLVRQFNKIGE